MSKRRNWSRDTKKLVREAGLAYLDVPPAWYSKTVSIYLYKSCWAVPCRAYFIKWLETDIPPVSVVEFDDLTGLGRAVLTVLDAQTRLISDQDPLQEWLGSKCVALALGLSKSNGLFKEGRLFHIHRDETEFVLSECGVLVTKRGRQVIYDFCGPPIWEKTFPLEKREAVLRYLHKIARKHSSK